MWGMGNLSVKRIRDLKEPGRYGDGDGLYLHIRSGGSKQWLLRVFVQGKRKDIGLGSASIISLSEARELAQDMRKSARTGGDPLAQRRRTKETPTYSEAAITVWELHKPTWKNPKHADQWINTQRTYAFPHFGSVRIDQVSSAHILLALTPIWLEKEETARRLKQRISMVFDWAKGVGHRSEGSPLEGVGKALPKQKHAVKHHDALSWANIPEFVAELHRRTNEATSAKALLLLVLTCMRSSEVRLAQWSEFDLENSIWTVPADRMKMKREHRVPLAKQAISLVNSCKGNGSNFVFPSDKINKPLSSSAFAALLKRMGREDITPHGFRSTFRDWSAENDAAPREILEMTLAHKVGDKTEQAYARSDLLDRRRIVLEKWARYAYGFVS
jgi:integrase